MTSAVRENYGALCNDCLREVLTSPDQIIAQDFAVYDGNHLCECGGDVCPCGSCASTLIELKAGNRDPASMGLCNVDTGFKWSPARGVL